MMILNNSSYFSIGEAATMLGVSVDTLRRWDKTGKLIADTIYALNGNRLYKIERIKQLIKDGRLLDKEDTNELISAVKAKAPQLKGYIQNLAKKKREVNWEKAALDLYALLEIK
jgi:DNA-binding transcriptional MerR regulator